MIVFLTHNIREIVCLNLEIYYGTDMDDIPILLLDLIRGIRLKKYPKINTNAANRLA